VNLNPDERVGTAPILAMPLWKYRLCRLAFWSQLIEETAMRTTLRLFSADYYDGQIERTLAAAYADAADIGELLAVGRRIRPRCVSQHSR
jgi:hypothetical protein